MNELYIIGNGFDKAHSLQTSYWDFREYLENYHIDFLLELEKMYGIQDFSDHAHHYSKEKLIELNNSIHEMLWKEFESNIGEAEDNSIIDVSDSVVDSMHLDGGPINIEDTMNEYWRNRYNFIEQLNELVFEWIKQVDLSEAKPIVKKIENNENDYFFTFNYTNTLEDIYNTPSDNILHIHGEISQYSNDDIIFGHGNADKIEYYRGLAEDASENFDEGKTSIYNALFKYYETTLKDTNYQIMLNRSYFNRLKNINKIIVIGHSMGDVDMPYFNEIKNSVLPDCEWTIYYYTDDDKTNCENACKQLKINKKRYEILHSNDFYDLN